MYPHVKPIPLSREQIERIQLAGRIVEREHELLRIVTAHAVGWARGGVSDEDLKHQALAYAAFTNRHPALPI